MKTIIYLTLFCALNAQALQMLQSKDGHETVKQKLNSGQSNDVQLSQALSPEQFVLKLDKLAKSGDPRAQFSLANMYHDGINVKVDTKLAFYWYSQVAEQGYASAQFNIGNGYYHGIGVADDFVKARIWYEKAAEQDFIAAQYNLAVMYRRGEGGDIDDNVAYYWYERAANLGYPQAQLILAKLTESGIGVEKSLDIAESWYLKAVSDSSPESQFYLAEYYERQGKFEKAREWYDKSAVQNHAIAQFNLAGMLLQGKGGDVDENKSVYWYEISAKSGHAESQSALDEIALPVIETEVSVDKSANDTSNGPSQSDFEMKYNLARSFEQVDAVDKAIEIYKELANAGFVPAQSRLAILYRRGQIIEQDDFKALHWALIAAESGDADAQFLSGVIYRSSSKVSPDIDRANHWYRIAADNGHAEAQYNLATMFLNGRGVETNIAKAIELFNMAASQNHINSQYSLALRYLRGEGVDKDYTKAVNLLVKASESGHVLAQYSLALRYQLGQGVEEDPELAIYWYQQSADQENSEAQYQLYKIFNNGNITDKNEDLSLMYLIRAAENEHTAAQHALTSITLATESLETDKNMITDINLKDIVATELTFESDLSNINSNTTMNEEVDQFLPGNFEETLLEALSKPPLVKHEEFIFDQTSALIPDKEEIARSLSSNSMEMTNLEKLVQRAKQGSPSALHNLSTLFSVGALVQKDDRKAFKLMQEAAILGLSKSQNSLAIMYINGNGVESNLNKALYWSRTSAQNGDNQGRQILLRLMRRSN